MSNYNSLKTTINANVKQNGVQAITGNILNSVLNAMVNALGAGYQFAGVATTATNPGSPDAKVFYVAATPGTYTNFSNLSLNFGEIAVFMYGTSWTKVLINDDTLNVSIAQLGFQFDSDKIIKGSYFSSSTGAIVPASTYDRTPLIEVDGG